MSVDKRERALQRAVAGGDEDAHRALRVSEFRRGARLKTFFLLSPDESGTLHMITRLGALCGFAHVARPESFRGDVIDGEERWATWAGPDDSLDDGRCEACHGQALLATNDRMLKIFCWQIAHGRTSQNRHPTDTVERFHPSTGRDLKEDETRPCESCVATPGRFDYGYGEGGCGTCAGRGWLLKTRR